MTETTDPAQMQGPRCADVQLAAAGAATRGEAEHRGPSTRDEVAARAAYAAATPAAHLPQAYGLVRFLPAISIVRVKSLDFLRAVKWSGSSGRACDACFASTTSSWSCEFPAHQAVWIGLSQNMGFGYGWFRCVR